MTVVHDVIEWIESAKSFSDLNEESFTEIVPSPRSVTSQLSEVHNRLLASVLDNDNEIKSNAYEFLKRIENLFQFSDTELQYIYESVFLSYYEERVENAMATLNYSIELKKEIIELERQYKISHRASMRVHRTIANKIATSLIDEFSEDGIDKQGLAIINRFVKSLGFKLEPLTYYSINEFKESWNIVHGEPIPIEVHDFKLNKNEDAYFSCEVDKYKPLVNGIQLESKGTLYITNKGIRFVGNNKTMNVTYNKIATFKFTEDGIVIYKNSGINPIFKFTSEVNITRFINITEGFHTKQLGE